MNVHGSVIYVEHVEVYYNTQRLMNVHCYCDDAPFQPSWILQRALSENTYETVAPSVEVGVTTTSPKQPEVDKKGGRSCLSSAGRLRQKIGRFGSKHQAKIRYAIYAVLFVAYCVYFTFAMLYEFGSEASVRLLCMTLLAVFLCLVSLLRSCAPGIRTPQPIIKIGHFLQRHQRILTMYV